MLTITLTLPPATEAKLRGFAAEHGKGVEDLVCELVEQGLITYVAANLPAQERFARWRDWLRDHPVHAVVVDDSRDGIYRDDELRST